VQSHAAGVPVIVLIGGSNGCFGGMGIVARCADRIVMSDVGRLAMSGPEVIESAHGVDEFDSRDRALVWRTTGGKHRWLAGDCDALVEDDVAAFRAAAIEAEHTLLGKRAALLKTPVEGDEAVALWSRLGVADAAKVMDLDVPDVHALRPT
jgi:malonate decarboxylase beta subunit